MCEIKQLNPEVRPVTNKTYKMLCEPFLSTRMLLLMKVQRAGQQAGTYTALSLCEKYVTFCPVSYRTTGQPGGLSEAPMASISQ